MDIFKLDSLKDSERKNLKTPFCDEVIAATELENGPIRKKFFSDTANEVEGIFPESIRQPIIDYLRVTPNKYSTHYSCVIRTLYFGRNGC
ncbi:MAG: hypothetical protein HRU09_14665, partial [Oligoflexales bacterium]|nr:hypothetical protein [Oligoflexales bacterium]